MEARICVASANAGASELPGQISGSIPSAARVAAFSALRVVPMMRQPWFSKRRARACAE